MRYLFSNKEVKVGDICIGLCIKEHLNILKISQYFPTQYSSWNQVGRIGIKVVWASNTRCKGYLVHEIKDSKKLVPYKVDGNLIYITFTTGNNVGLIKYEQNKTN